MPKTKKIIAKLKTNFNSFEMSKDLLCIKSYSFVREEEWMKQIDNRKESWSADELKILHNSHVVSSTNSYIKIIASIN